MYVLMKVIFNYLYDFYIFKFNNLKVIPDLYCLCLTQTLSKTTSKASLSGVSWRVSLY
jgi:hypothetical protein